MDAQFAHEHYQADILSLVPVCPEFIRVVRYPSPLERMLAFRDGALLVAGDGSAGYWLDGTVYLL